MAKIKVDLHDIYNDSNAIDKALLQVFEDAIEKKIREVEIIPGKGSGQLKKKKSASLFTASTYKTTLSSYQ